MTLSKVEGQSDWAGLVWAISVPASHSQSPTLFPVFVDLPDGM
jgi:hypothetical protein